MTHTSYTHFFGIDTAKKTLELAGVSGQASSFPNDPSGRAALVARLRKMTPDTSVILVAIEPTGGYERAMIEALQEAGLAVAMVQPGCVRHFALSRKVLAKTDAIDARIIAQFAQANQPEPVAKADGNTVRLRSLRDRRDQVVEDRVREQNRLEACADGDIARRIRANIRSLEKQEEKLDGELAALVVSDERLHRKSTAMQEVVGVGPGTANTLLAHFPELGKVNCQQAAALAGLAPYDRQSGGWRGKSRVYGGRAAIRRALYMAAVTAARSNAVLREVYQRLVGKGKPKKVALVAVARKLLVYLNTLIRRVETGLNSPAAAPEGALAT